jgi:tetratricopeptide (TPR) repeat protein
LAQLPTDPQVLTQAAESALNAGDLDGAASFCRRALLADPNNSGASFLLGISRLRAGSLSEAHHHLTASLAEEPESYNVLTWLSSISCRLGRYDEAVSLCARAICIAPGRSEAYLNLGLAQLITHDYAGASRNLERASALRPGIAELEYHLGNARRMNCDPNGASEAFRKAIDIEPGVSRFRVALGLVLLELDQPDEALKQAQTVLELDPGSVDALNLKTQVLDALGRTDEAEQCMESALAADDRSADAHLHVGMSYQFKGEFSKARRHLKKAIELSATIGCAYHSLAQLETFQTPLHPLITRMKALVEEGLPAVDEVPIRYALGKAHEDLRDFEVAMVHFDEANRLNLALNHSRQAWNGPDEDRKRLEVQRTFSKESLAALAKGGLDSDLPVFVIGMIRSGTTLTEQILSSHREICPAGELSFWASLATRHGHLPEIAASPEEMQATTDRYLGLLRRSGPIAERVTDKYPTNYKLVGPIHAHLPNARFIHVRRDPVDTCLSIWKTRMSRSPAFTNARDNIVSAYRQYRAYMVVWRTVLPPDRLLEIDYEELVSEPETVSRRMIEFCRLDWDPACLRPERNQRPVSTPSLWRIRKPIDEVSVDRWRLYEPWLGSFRELHEATPAEKAA